MKRNTAFALHGIDQILAEARDGGEEAIQCARKMLADVAEVTSPPIVLYLLGQVQEMVEILAEMEGAK
jgi:hypothetical protein